MVKEIEQTPGAIMFIDEIHTVIGAGRHVGGAMDASNLLKPALSSGSIRCIGSTTYKEYRQYFEKDRALVRRFQKIDINEPTVPDAIEIMKGLKPYFEEFHKVRYTDEAIKSAVELSVRYIHDRKLPDKAIDIIDETGASQMLLPAVPAQEDDHAEGDRSDGRLDRAHPAENRVGGRRRGAGQSRGQSEAARLRPGQRIDALTSAIKLARAGLREPEKADRLLPVLRPDRRRQDRGGQAPRGGAGRAVPALRHVGVHGAPHRLALIGAPPGYVGFDQGGLLTPTASTRTRIRCSCSTRSRRRIPNLYNILLQVMDHGKLTDHNGKSVDFANTIIIMTTNAGASDMAKPPIGFGRTKREGEDTEAINRMFTPEFRNRLDATIAFAACRRRSCAPSCRSSCFSSKRSSQTAAS